MLHVIREALLQGHQRLQIGFLPQPGNIGMAAYRAGRGAGRIDQDAIKTCAVVAAVPLEGVGHRGLCVQGKPRQIVTQPRYAAR